MNQTIFTKAELERYSRHIIIPEFNIEGQKKLKEAKVLVVGAGGLGSPLLLYLAAAGVGTIGLVDFDVVDDSNLQRQVLYGVEDLGKLKIEMAAERIKSLNPHIEVELHPTLLSSENAKEIIQKYDVVADGTDNFPTRYLVNDACVLLGKTNVYGSIFRFEGQVSVFNYKNEKGEIGPNYRDLFPTPPPAGLVPSCAEGGVLGVLPGIIGSLQASEVIKVITGLGEPLSGRLFLFDALTFETRTLKVRRRDNNPLNGTNPTITKLIDYQEFCGIPQKEEIVSENEPSLKEITVQELAEMKENGKGNFQLIDVRNPYEYDIANLGGELLPLADLEDWVLKVATDKIVVVHCRSGKRSAEAIEKLEKYGFEDLYNLKGGILAWAKEIDSEMAQY